MRFSMFLILSSAVPIVFVDELMLKLQDKYTFTNYLQHAYVQDYGNLQMTNDECLLHIGKCDPLALESISLLDADYFISTNKKTGEITSITSPLRKGAWPIATLTNWIETRQHTLQYRQVFILDNTGGLFMMSDHQGLFRNYAGLYGQHFPNKLTILQPSGYFSLPNHLISMIQTFKNVSIQSYEALQNNLTTAAINLQIFAKSYYADIEDRFNVSSRQKRS